MSAGWLMGQGKGPVRVNLAVTGNDSTQLEDFYGTIEDLDNHEKYPITSGEMVLKHPGRYKFTVRYTGFYNHESEYSITRDTSLSFVLRDNPQEQRNFTVKAVAAREKTGFVYTEVNARKLSSQNLGQDFTYLIANTPSAVTTSDAGAGVGYTGIRIRGSDATRINVTINGIPINDAESHGVYWVNMPDLASSTSSVQIQRGVGTSTIGTGSFGANINVQNTSLMEVPFFQVQQSYGSFNTSKSTLQFGTGRIRNFNFGGRLSRIVSDGYVDRGSSDLQAFQFNLNYNAGSWVVNAVSFGGKEKTYQSWYGTPESRINNDVPGMNQYADRNYLTPDQKNNLLNSGRTYNFYTYPNQTDNYWQNHYQLHIGKRFNDKWAFKSSFFTTTGKGYYEEFKEGASFADYGVGNFINGADTITGTNLVRQRWLDNIFYGNFSSLNYKSGNTDVILGAGYTEYRGKHHGDIIYADIAQPFGKDYRYYFSRSNKKEINSFLKVNRKVTEALRVDAEFQVRHIDYWGRGSDNDLKTIDFSAHYNFYNPKIGVSYDLGRGKSVYSSYSIGNREPVRTDFTDNAVNEIPKPEHLQDLELGYIYKARKHFFQANFYNMQYKNQLVVTGELNDVGNSLRKNVANSYRRGIELMWTSEVAKKLVLETNLTLSQNKILNFEDVYFNYDSNTNVRVAYNKTDIAFSPSVIGFAGITDKHLRNTDLTLNFKYVGKQYLDNTLNNSRKINPYYTLNFIVQKTVKLKNSGVLAIKGMVNNITSIYYSNNGYTFKYVTSGQLVQENFYYPQAPLNFLIGLDFKFY